MLQTFFGPRFWPTRALANQSSVFNGLRSAPLENGLVGGWLLFDPKEDILDNTTVGWDCLQQKAIQKGPEFKTPKIPRTLGKKKHQSVPKFWAGLLRPFRCPMVTIPQAKRSLRVSRRQSAVAQKGARPRSSRPRKAAPYKLTALALHHMFNQVLSV